VYQSYLISVIEVDFLDSNTLGAIPYDVDVAYYLIHSMSSSIDKFDEMEKLADKNEKRLLLYAEMKLPGEAWLEFRIKNNTLYQTATFRPLGLWGRIYWYAVWPLHIFVFRGMLNRIA